MTHICELFKVSKLISLFFIFIHLEIRTWVHFKIQRPSVFMFKGFWKSYRMQSYIYAISVK